MTTWKDLKDQPIYILGLTILASVSATAAFYEKFLVPARDPNAIQRATILQSQLDTSQRLVAEIQPLQQRLHKAEADFADRSAKLEAEVKVAKEAAVKALAEAKARIQDAEWANTFAIGSSYPVGLERVGVGETAERLAAAFPGKAIDRTKESYHSIDQTGHAVFDRVTFYFDDGSKDKRITHISYWSRALDGRSKDDDWLSTRLAVSLGPPKVWGQGYYSWEPKGPVHTFVRLGQLLIMRAGLRPNGWPKVVR
ncbi:hypothetical protein [Bosea vaviloviae]|uniref:hypothetical protein n=1 Tax=Bosea vaviloviae TaxID=1526658 RepID=UPI0011E04C03|nr:hypothetical protein [Bosea vaviloviae]